MSPRRGLAEAELPLGHGLDPTEERSSVAGQCQLQAPKNVGVRDIRC